MLANQTPQPDPSQASAAAQQSTGRRRRSSSGSGSDNEEPRRPTQRPKTSHELQAEDVSVVRFLDLAKFAEMACQEPVEPPMPTIPTAPVWYSELKAQLYADTPLADLAQQGGRMTEQKLGKVWSTSIHPTLSSATTLPGAILPVELATAIHGLRLWILLLARDSFDLTEPDALEKIAESEHDLTRIDQGSELLDVAWFLGLAVQQRLSAEAVPASIVDDFVNNQRFSGVLLWAEKAIRGISPANAAFICRFAAAADVAHRLGCDLAPTDLVFAQVYTSLALDAIPSQEECPPRAQLATALQTQRKIGSADAFLNALAQGNVVCIGNRLLLAMSEAHAFINRARKAHSLAKLPSIVVWDAENTTPADHVLKFLHENRANFSLHVYGIADVFADWSLQLADGAWVDVGTFHETHSVEQESTDVAIIAHLLANINVLQCRPLIIISRDLGFNVLERVLNAMFGTVRTGAVDPQILETVIASISPGAGEDEYFAGDSSLVKRAFGKEGGDVALADVAKKLPGGTKAGPICVYHVTDQSVLEVLIPFLSLCESGPAADLEWDGAEMV